MIGNPDSDPLMAERMHYRTLDINRSDNSRF